MKQVTLVTRSTNLLATPPRESLIEWLLPCGLKLFRDSRQHLGGRGGRGRLRGRHRRCCCVEEGGTGAFGEGWQLTSQLQKMDFDFLKYYP